jgi:quercetin dioxygenase-like cupin family protein
MKLIRVYNDADGESHIDDVEVEMDDQGTESRATGMWAVEGVIFREIPPGGSADWHTAPRRQLAINLSGEAEIQVSDGTKRRVGPGQLFLVEDTTGKGHMNTWLDDKVHAFAFMPLKNPE